MISPRPSFVQEHIFFVVIAAFLHAGPMKADPRLAWLRVDLTLICAALLAVMLVASLVRDALRIAGDQILWSLCFLGLMLPGVLLAPVSAYAKEKSLFLVTLTLLAFMAGLVAGQRSRGLERLVMWLVMFSLLITGDALLKVATGAATLERVSGFSGTTITLGRAAGLVFLVEAAQFLLWPGRVRRQWLNLALATPAAAGVLFSGSKGPLLSALLALVVVPPDRGATTGFPEAGASRGDCGAGLGVRLVAHTFRILGPDDDLFLRAVRGLRNDPLAGTKEGSAFDRYSSIGNRLGWLCRSVIRVGPGWTAVCPQSGGGTLP